MIYLEAVSLLILTLDGVVGHGNMIMPYIFQDFLGIGMKIDTIPSYFPPGVARPHGGFIGCGRNDTKNDVWNTCTPFFYNNFTVVDKITLPWHMRSYPVKEVGRYDKNPWASPGAAKIFSPCSIAGGNKNGCFALVNPEDRANSELVERPCDSFGTYKGGADAREYYEDRQRQKDIRVTNWTRGSVQDVAYTITANHGGGYQYRLCKVEKVDGLFLTSKVTEECFQKTPLEFVGDKHRVAWNNRSEEWEELPALTTNVGTTPKGSSWRRYPVPACKNYYGGARDKSGNSNLCPDGPNFEPPVTSHEYYGKKNLQGYGASNITVFKYVTDFAIVDQVQVPEDIPTGYYVLSWRWDTDQYDAVWASCALMNIQDEFNDESDSEEDEIARRNRIRAEREREREQLREARKNNRRGE